MREASRSRQRKTVNDQKEGKAISSLATEGQRPTRHNDSEEDTMKRNGGPKDAAVLFDAEVVVEEARRLPRLFDPILKAKTHPTAFVTFTSFKQGSNENQLESELVVSPMATAGGPNPRWNFKAKTRLPVTALLDPKRHLILKLWHWSGATAAKNTGEGLDLEAQHVIGFAAVDVSPLRAGFPDVSGWYNIMDFVGRCRGQIKVSVTPFEDVKRLVEKGCSQQTLLERRDSEVAPEALVAPRTPSTYCVAARYSEFPSHVIQHTEQVVLATPVPAAPVDERLEATPAWIPPEITVDPEGTTHSFLRSKLTDLERATERMKRLLIEPVVTQDKEDERGWHDQGISTSAGGQKHTADTGGLSLEELERGIRENLLALRHTAAICQATNFNNGDASAAEPWSLPSPRGEPPKPTRRSPPSPLSISSSSSPDVSEEIADALRVDGRENHGAGGSGDASNRPPLIDICDDTLEDLGQIDWSRVLRSEPSAADLGNDEADEGDPTSRVAPEGGNPSEDPTPAPSRRLRPAPPPPPPLAKPPK